jgi:hypothetical protein
MIYYLRSLPALPQAMCRQFQATTKKYGGQPETKFRSFSVQRSGFGVQGSAFTVQRSLGGCVVDCIKGFASDQVLGRVNNSNPTHFQWVDGSGATYEDLEACSPLFSLSSLREKEKKKGK